MATKQDVINHHRRAEAFVEENEFDKALAEYTEAIELGGELIGSNYFQRCGIYLKMGKEDQMIADLKMAADYGIEGALEWLNNNGFNYTPTPRTPPPLKGSFTGKGKLTSDKGSVYEGDIVDGEPHGKGKYTFADGTFEEGEYVNGEFVKGKYTYADGDFEEGEFTDGELVKGKRQYVGDFEEGDFAENNLHGKGKRITEDGEILEGDFVEGDLHGKGKFTDEDGNVYEGDFVEGEKHGKGKMIYADGRVEEGNWEEDEFVGGGN